MVSALLMSLASAAHADIQTEGAGWGKSGLLGSVDLEGYISSVAMGAVRTGKGAEFVTVTISPDSTSKEVFRIRFSEAHAAIGLSYNALVGKRVKVETGNLTGQIKLIVLP